MERAAIFFHYGCGRIHIALLHDFFLHCWRSNVTEKHLHLSCTMTTVQLLIVSEGDVSVELLWNVQPHFQPHFFGAQHFSHCLNTPLRGFFKRVENKLLPRVKQSPWARRRWDWRNSERWCQAHRDFKKYKLQQIWICTVFFFPFFFTEHTSQVALVCEGATWFSRQTSVYCKALCLLGRIHDSQRS